MRLLGVWGLTAVAAFSCSVPAHAAPRYAFDVPGGSLANALVVFGRQAGVSLGGSDPRLTATSVRALRGTFTLERGLTRLLAGTGYTFQIIDRYTIRIIRAQPIASRRPERRSLESKAPSSGSLPGPEIMVTASKRPAPLLNFPGSAVVVSGDDLGLAGRIADGTGALVEKVPGLISTSLGRGRNKLFIRGIADSSFTGPTQATVGQYLGDMRMNYSAPDPDLSLYDVDRIEILEGPQGTLYGAGTLGGIMNIVPAAPDVSRITANVRLGLSATARGGPGYDAAGVVNFPLVEGTAGIRALAYSSMSGGYIDDPRRRAADVNDVRTAGGRIALRLLPGDWEIELGGVLQDVEAQDSQYVQPDRDELVRSGGAQPYSNRYVLWRATVKRSFGWGNLTSATGLVRHRLSATYDLPDSEAQSEESTKIDLFSHETRLASNRGHRFNWVAGVSVLQGSDRFERRIGPAPLTGVRNETLEAAVFGEATVPVTRDLSATAGGRFSFTRLAGEPTGADVDFGEELARTQTRVVPTFALSWRNNQRFGGYIRYQQGFRAGGLSVQQTGDTLTAKPFEGDKITSVEAGVRLGRPGSGRLHATLAGSYSQWRDVQADLISPSGQPFTENIGSGKIFAFEGSAIWTPTPLLSAEVHAFASTTALKSSAALDVQSDDENLPNIPRLAITGSIKYLVRRFAGGDLELEALGRYVGKSQLGFGTLLDVAQGDYFDASAGATLMIGKTEFSVDISNALDSRGNRFSYGNPFTLSVGRQFTPLRPLTVRVGISRSF